MPVYPPKTILLVEDEAILAILEKQQLESEGYRIIQASTGEKALEIIINKSEPIDLILMDIDLGEGIDGTWAAKEIQKIKNIPVLFLSSHTEKDIVQRTEEITHYGYVVKNSSFTVLDASIKMAFKLYEAHTRIAEQVQDLQQINEELVISNEELRISNEEFVALNEELKESEIKFSTCFQHAPVLISITDLANGIYIDVNEEALRLSGYKRTEVIGHTAAELGWITQETRDLLVASLKTSGRITDLEMNFTTKDGKAITGIVKGEKISISGRDCLLTVTIDITARKIVEEKLRNEHWRLSTILESTHVGTWEWNIQTGETVYNDIWAEIIGYTLEELSPLNINTWMNVVHPDDLKISEALLARHFSGELPFYECECRMKHKDGYWVVVHDRGKVTKWSEDGKPLLMFGTHTDLSGLKQEGSSLDMGGARLVGAHALLRIYNNDRKKN